MYTSKLVDIVNEYNNTYHNTIKMKLVDLKSSAYIDFGAENNDRNPNFKVGNYVKISRYKNIFPKSYVSNWFEEICY